MTRQVLSEVSAMVAEDREAELAAMYRELTSGPLPNGLIRTELLREAGGRWRVQSLWRDVAALEAVRTGRDRPAAPDLFRRVGAEPTLSVFEVVVAHALPLEDLL